MIFIQTDISKCTSFTLKSDTKNIWFGRHQHNSNEYVIEINDSEDYFSNTFKLEISIDIEDCQRLIDSMQRAINQYNCE